MCEGWRGASLPWGSGNAALSQLKTEFQERDCSARLGWRERGQPFSLCPKEFPVQGLMGTDRPGRNRLVFVSRALLVMKILQC